VGYVPKELEDLITRLWEMSIDEKEEVINALVTHEGF
jgi:hypothetical protein